MTKIIANMIVKNESDNYLIPVLERLSEQVDVIAITDDASTDNTAEICSRYTDHVNVLPESMFNVHEGQLRQLSWDFMEQATEPEPGDLILAIDADELLYETTWTLRDLAQDEYHEIFNVRFFHMWSPTHYRVDGGWKPHGSTRLFKYRRGGVFKDKQLGPGSEPGYVTATYSYYRNLFKADSGLEMKHLSYIKDSDKQIKYERYMKIDGGKFHASSHIQSIADPIERVSLGEWPWT
jgi:glycosyltransferase involved in cell wall biosynthesis